MNVLVTGGNGFIGSALLRKLLLDGIHIPIAAVRKHDNKLPLDMAVVEVGNIAKVIDWSDVLKNVDVIIHTAARAHVLKEYKIDPVEEFNKVNVAGTLVLAREAARAGVKRFIFISSIGVNGSSNTRPFVESDEPNPKELYAVSKLEAELGLKEVAKKSAMEIVIIRPPLVYGHGAPGNFDKLLRWICWPVPIPLASVKNRRSFIYVGNLIDILSICINHPKVVGKTYLVSDGEDLSTPEFVRRIAKSINCSCKLCSFPPVLIRWIGMLLGKSHIVSRLLNSLVIDSSAIRRDLNWIPQYSVQQGLDEMNSQGAREN